MFIGSWVATVAKKWCNWCRKHFNPWNMGRIILCPSIHWQGMYYYALVSCRHVEINLCFIFTHHTHLYSIFMSLILHHWASTGNVISRMCIIHTYLEKLMNKFCTQISLSSCRCFVWRNIVGFCENNVQWCEKKLVTVFWLKKCLTCKQPDMS